MTEANLAWNLYNKSMFITFFNSNIKHTKIYTYETPVDITSAADDSSFHSL